jgi:hypothetical protein
LANIQDAQERKQFIGNVIYHEIDRIYHADLAGKITGMLLDESAVDLGRLSSDANYLSFRAFEAN